jgi:hypothetical protein
VSPDEKPPGRSLKRADFEVVIRRAVELAAAQGDLDERVSEAELVRIGGELGLPADQVRQALYEQPQLEVEPHWYDSIYDRPILSESRVVPVKADVTMRRIEEYLSSREYMQLVRRRSGELAFIPAEDAISRLARGLSRPGSRFHMAHARRLIVSVQPIGTDRSHIRMDTDFSEQRASSVKGAIGAGVVAGSLISLAPLHAILAPIHAGVPAELAIAAGTLAVTCASTTYVTLKIAASRFRNRLMLARREINGLLDRAENSERLEPPPAPWRRSLRARLFGEPPAG